MQREGKFEIGIGRGEVTKDVCREKEFEIGIGRGEVTKDVCREKVSLR